MEQCQTPINDAEHPEQLLQRHARRLNNRWWRWPLLGPSYHLLAGALDWADVTPYCWGKWAEIDNTLRPLWHYRTGLIFGEARPFGELWGLGKRLFPRWVGFHVAVHGSKCRCS
jgi:hypothetical protein